MEDYSMQYGLQELLDENHNDMIQNNSFIDFQEPYILDDIIYRQLQNKAYGYAVTNKTIDESLESISENGQLVLEKRLHY